MSTNDETFTGNKYNRIAGLEYNLASNDNRWNGKVYYHQNIHENITFKDAAMAANISYSSQFMTASMNQALTGSGLRCRNRICKKERLLSA